MSLDLGELNAIIDADDRGFHRTIDRAGRRMSGLRDNFDKGGQRAGHAFGDALRTTTRLGLRQFLDQTEQHLGDAAGRFGQFFAHINRSARRIALPAVLALVATAAAGAASSLGPLITLVGALASAIGGLAAAVPVFVSGAAAAIGTLKLGFQGLGDAIAGDEEALEKLPPAAREVVSAVRGMEPAWESVTRAVQAELWDGIGGQLTSLASRVLPRLETGLSGVATGFNALASEALSALDSAEAMSALDAVLEHTQAGIEAFAGGIAAWIGGLATLIESTAPLLSDAGAAAARLGERFQAWMLEAQETGRINDLIDTMKETLSLLGSLLVNLGSIFSSVFGAANEAGGGLLGTIEELTGRFADWLDTAEGTEALNAFFTSLAKVGAAATPVILALADAFATKLAPKIGEIATGIGPSLETVIERVGDAVGNLDIDALAEAFGRFLEAASLLLGPLTGLLNTLIMISPVLLPILAGVATGIAVFKGLQAVMVVVTVAQWAWNAALYANPVVWIIGLIVALIAIVVLLVMHWDTVTAAITASWEFLKEKAVEIWSAITMWIGQKVEAAKVVIETVWNAIKDFFSTIWESLVELTITQVDAILGVINWFKELPGKVAGWFQGVKDSAIEKLESLVSWVKGIPDMIMGAIGDLGSLLFDAGADILQGLLDGIQSMWSNVQSKFGELTSMIPDIKGPADKDKRLLTPAGEMIMGGLVDGIDRGIPELRRTLEGLTTDIGLQVDGDAAPIGSDASRIEATATLSDADRELLRELAEARNLIDVQASGGTRIEQQRRDAMVVS